MTRRNRDWNEDLAEDLKDPKFAHGFFRAALEDGLPLNLALGKVIHNFIGVKEFATLIGMASPNLLRVISPKHNPTQETLNRLLKPFGLQLGLIVLSEQKDLPVCSNDCDMSEESANG